MKSVITTLLLIIILLTCCGPDEFKDTVVTSLGEPTDVPTIFGRNIISLNSGIEFGVERDHVNNEIYFTKFYPSNGETSIMILTRSEKYGWSQLLLASFSDTKHEASPNLTCNGNRVYFTSFRNSSFSRVWYANRKSDKTWDIPILVQFPDTITKDIRNISFINDSVFYFDMLNGTNDNDIFRGVIRENICVSIEHTGDKVNSNNPEVEAAVSFDESYMIFYSINREGHLGNPNSGDLYISYRIDGEWCEPSNMGIPINSEREENWPTIDYENNVLYFSSNRSSSNGYPDIYWVKLDSYITK